MSNPFKNQFKLRQPCSNCPFRVHDGLELRPGRLEEIIDALLADDHASFPCHKTVHHPRTRGSWDNDGGYRPSGRESMCAGAMIFLEKVGRPSVGMRLGRVFGVYGREELEPHFSAVIDPPG